MLEKEINMEKYIDIPTESWFSVKGVLNLKQRSEKLIIFAHGFKGNMNEAHYVCGKDYFLGKGYDTFRFNFYDEWERYRKLHTCTVENHSTDLQAVLEYFSQYKEVYVAWHSLAWPVIVWISSFPENIAGIVFWDPAFNMKISAEKIFERDGKYFVPSTWKIVEVNKEMYGEFLHEDYATKLSDIGVSHSLCHCVYAEEGGYIRNKKATDDIWISSVIISESDHCFTQEWKLQELFEATYNFIAA